jgi:DNA-directed RNA polymerase I, II, and III subunit RPABC2
MQTQDMMQHIYKMSGMHRPKDSDDDGDGDSEGDEETRANTHANAARSNSKNLVDVDAELEEESDATSNTGTDTGDDTETDATESVGTGMDEHDDNDNDNDNEDNEFSDIEETPAMLAKKVATAASAVANSDAKKKATIANKRAIASSKPPKGKATLQDIATLQNSYDDVAHEEGGEHIDDSDDANDDSDDDINYLRKFETEMHENYIASHHHEMLHLNNAEVNALARVVRNTDGAIIDVMHKTMPFLTKYEKTRILGQRAKQLNQGAQPMIPVDKKIIDGYLIAQLELQQKALPFIIRRPLPGGKSEYWRVSDLEII